MAPTDDHPSQDQGPSPETRDMIDLGDSFNMMEEGEMLDKMERMIGIVIDCDLNKELLRLLLFPFLGASDVDVRDVIR